MGYVYARTALLALAVMAGRGDPNLVHYRKSGSTNVTIHPSRASTVSGGSTKPPSITPNEVEHILHGHSGPHTPGQHMEGDEEDEYEVIVALHLANLHEKDVLDQIALWAEKVIHNQSSKGHGDKVGIIKASDDSHRRDVDFFMKEGMQMLQSLRARIMIRGGDSAILKSFVGEAAETVAMASTLNSAQIIFNIIDAKTAVHAVVLELQDCLFPPHQGLCLYIRSKTGHLEFDQVERSITGVQLAYGERVKFDRKARIAASVRAIQTRRGTAITETDAAASAEAASPAEARAMESLALDGPAAVPNPTAAAPRGTARGLRSPYLF